VTGLAVATGKESGALGVDDGTTCCVVGRVVLVIERSCPSSSNIVISSSSSSSASASSSSSSSSSASSSSSSSLCKCYGLRRAACRCGVRVYAILLRERIGGRHHHIGLQVEHGQSQGRFVYIADPKVTEERKISSPRERLYRSRTLPIMLVKGADDICKERFCCL